MVCARSRHTLRQFTLFIVVFDVRPVHECSDIDTNRSETASSCCSMSVLSVMQSARLSELDANATFMKLRALQMNKFVRCDVEAPDSGIALKDCTLARYNARHVSFCSNVDLMLAQQLQMVSTLTGLDIH